MEQNFCACGCGSEIEIGKRFKYGHRYPNGNERWLHRKAKILFGKEFCEICGISAEESKVRYKQYLAMHCLGGEMKYHVMEAHNWKTFCHSCHGKFEYNNLSDERKEKITARIEAYNQSNPIVSDETRKKLGKASARMWSSRSKEDRKRITAPMIAGTTGRVTTEEHRRNYSEAAKNRPPSSEETKRKISETMKKRVFTEEHRRKINEALRARSLKRT